MKQHWNCLFGAILAIVILSTASTATASTATAEVRLPEIFASDMVLQRDTDLPVWGWADAGESVTVTLEGQSQTATAGADGRWQVTFKALKAGGPVTMTVKGKNEIKLENLLIGDVWLCSGQSNMEWPMNRLPDSQADLPKANQPKIRLFQVSRTWQQRPQTSLTGNWSVCTPESVASFSAVGYYFGSCLQRELDVPIGLINASWGGTRIEPWTTPEGFKSVPALKEIARLVDAKDPSTTLHKELVGKAIRDYKAWIAATEKNLAENRPVDPPPAYPDLLMPYANHQQATVLHNAMVHPFVPLAMKGVIWYQGESNVGEGMLYAEKMKALINGWRTAFNNPRLGFYYVQLAPYNYGGDPTRLPKLWEAQAAVEKVLPWTGMAVINDIGNLKDIHPAGKDKVGSRLALLALSRTYGKLDVVAASPELDRMEIDGATIVLTFKNAKELKTRDGKSPDWFEIAGADGLYHKAEARIDGTTIRLTSPSVDKPFAMQFAWNQLAEPNVQNEAGLQLGAFRSGEIPERGVLDQLVPSAKDFKVVYSFDPTHPVMADNGTRLIYRTDKSGEITGRVKRVGYFLYLKPKDDSPRYVFVTMPPLDRDLKKLGVPTKASGARFQKNVTDVTVRTNVSGVESGTFAEGCNVEFWDCNYGAPNAVNVPGASADVFDFGDIMTTNVSPGYGSMQVHNYAKKQSIFVFNNFRAGNGCDVGIGNCPTGQNPDWTFSKSAETYEGGQMLILVETE